MHRWRGPTHNLKWLVETLAPRVMRNVKVPVKELVNGLKMDYKKSTNYHQMWRACDLVRDWYLGGQQKSFHMIPALLNRVKEVDHDCIVDWSTHEDNKIFQQAFICPNATRSALRHL